MIYSFPKNEKILKFRKYIQMNLRDGGWLMAVGDEEGLSEEED